MWGRNPACSRLSSRLRRGREIPTSRLERRMQPKVAAPTLRHCTTKPSFLCAPRRIVGQNGCNQTVVLTPGRPINNRPQVNNLPYIAAKARCATKCRKSKYRLKPVLPGCGTIFDAV
jgi:hypothetical protein